jgi:rod shape-determining protein MreB
MSLANGKFCMSVDFGTTNTLVYVKNDGVVVNEASLIALRTENSKKNAFTVVDAGSDVCALIGRTAPQVSVQSPLSAGVINDVELAKVLLQTLTTKFLPWSRHLPIPSAERGILISAPREITEYERRAFEESARSLGFANVGIIDEPLAAALGAGLALFEPRGQMLVDLGSGISEAVVTSSGFVAASGSVRQGGNDLDEQIVAFLKEHHDFVIAHSLAKRIKETFGSASGDWSSREIQLSGKCLKAKLPRKMIIRPVELSCCIKKYVDQVETLILSVIEKTEPELVSDLLDSGVWLSGGGSLLNGLPEELSRRLGFTVRRVQNPLAAVIAGSGKIIAEPKFSQLCRVIH